MPDHFRNDDQRDADQREFKYLIDALVIALGKREAILRKQKRISEAKVLEHYKILSDDPKLRNFVIDFVNFAYLYKEYWQGKQANDSRFKTWNVDIMSMYLENMITAIDKIERGLINDGRYDEAKDAEYFFSFLEDRLTPVWIESAKILDKYFDE